MKAHFVTFNSPGTFVAEQTTKPIAAWDIERAKHMAAKITERHAATPYGFFFTTRARGPEDLDSEVVKTSPMYYLGGKIETLAQIEARGDAHDRILISNMKSNKWDRVWTTTTGWKWTQPLQESDVVLAL